MEIIIVTTILLNSSKLSIAQSCLGKEIQSFNAYGTKDLRNDSSQDVLLRVFIELLCIRAVHLSLLWFARLHIHNNNSLC